MNGYSLTDKLKRTRQWTRLTAVEQALYHELVTVCNERNWADVFLCSNKRLYKALNIAEGTLKKARKTLVDAGLIYYRSGKVTHTVSAYSFTKPFESKPDASENFPPTTEDLTSTVDLPATSTIDVPATSTIADYINLYSIKTPSIPRECGRRSRVHFINFGDIKNQLMADQTWKELTAMHSGLGIKFVDILPGQIDIFLQYIVATGEEHTIQTLSDAKRRFFWWWKNQGRNAYENNKENNSSTIVW